MNTRHPSRRLRPLQSAVLHSAFVAEPPKAPFRMTAGFQTDTLPAKPSFAPRRGSATAGACRCPPSISSPRPAAQPFSPAPSRAGTPRTGAGGPSFIGMQAAPPPRASASPRRGAPCCGRRWPRGPARTCSCSRTTWPSTAASAPRSSPGRRWWKTASSPSPASTTLGCPRSGRIKAEG